MPISFDGLNIGQVYAGGPIKEVYSGSQLVWSSGPSWPVTGSWSGDTTGTATTVASFTVTEAGVYDFQWAVTWAGSGTIYGGAMYRVNTGSDIPGTGVVTGPGTSTVNVSGVVLQAGDVVEFRVLSGGTFPATGSWSIERTGDVTLPMLLNLDSAKTTKYRVAFAGSSTMQGWGQPRYESTAHLLTARLLRHVSGAGATKMVSQTSGSLAGPTLPGFHFLNAALGGTTSANYLDATKRNLVNGYGPDLLIHMVGSNDYSEQVAPATYKSRMRTAIQSINGAQHVLVHQQRREDRADTGYTWAQYGQALKELADELANVYFVDVSQAWHQLRNGATDWFAADKIHCTWKGAQGLATAIADAIGLDEHVGETIWAFDATTMPLSNPTTTVTPTSDSLVQMPAIAPSTNVAPGVFSGDKGNRLSFNISGLRHADTAAWGGSYSFPITFYVVQQAFGNTGTTVQPWFSRSNNPDDGWWWAWRDSGSTEVRAALNSAFSGAVNYGVNNYPMIIAIHMTANNRAAVFVNSDTPIGYLDPDRISELSGPWMESLRLNANSTLASYGAHSMYEMRFEQSDYNYQSVRTRMRQLSEKYGVSIIGDTSPLQANSAQSAAPETIPEDQWYTLGTMIVMGNGTGRVDASWRFNSTGFYLGSHTRIIQIMVNGVKKGEWSKSAQAGSWESTGSVSGLNLSHGDRVSIRAHATVNNNSLRTVEYWNMTLTPT